MTARQVLTPEDDLFGRVALYNKLLTLNEILECSQNIAAELAAGRPRRSLAAVLVAKGYLSPEQAGAVEAAVRRQTAAAQGRSAAPAAPASAASPKPLPMQTHAPTGHSRITVAVTGKRAVANDSPLDEARLREVVARISPARIYPEMLEHLSYHRLSVIDPKKLAAAIGEPEAEVLKALVRWERCGVVSRVGSHAYSFNPTPREEEEVQLFLRAWHDAHWHSRVLGYIIAEE